MLAGAVKQLRAANPDTVFAAAGDLIGASTFESFIQQGQADDRRAQRGGPRGVGGGQPRVRPGLQRPGEPGDGAVQRHDQPRTVARTGSTSPPTCARTATTARCSRGRGPRTSARVKVGFVGAVTEHLPELVSPAGIADDPRHRHRQRGQRRGQRPQGRRRGRGGHAGPRGCAEHQLRHDGRRPDVRLRVDHHRASTTTSTRSSPATPTWPTTASSRCPVGTGRPVTERPVVSAGQYGMALNKLVFTVDTATGRGRGPDPRAAALQTARHVRRPRRCACQLPGRPEHRGDRRGGSCRGRSAGCGGRWARSVARSTAASSPTDDGEPWRGVDPGQPGRRGPEVGHQRPRSPVRPRSRS